jgi:archaellum component FlaC
MGDIYDYIADQEAEGRWYRQMPDNHKKMVEDLKDKVRRLENRVKYWKNRAKKAECFEKS